MLIGATDAMPTELRKPLIVISYAHADEPEQSGRGRSQVAVVRHRLSQAGDQARRGRSLDRSADARRRRIELTRAMKTKSKANSRKPKSRRKSATPDTVNPGSCLNACQSPPSSFAIDGIGFEGRRPSEPATYQP